MPPLHPSLSLKSSDNSGLCYLSFQWFNLSCLSHLCPPGLVSGGSCFRFWPHFGRSDEKLPSFVHAEIHYFETFPLLPHALTHCLCLQCPPPPPAPRSSCCPFLFHMKICFLPGFSCFHPSQRSSQKRLLRRGLWVDKCVNVSLLIPN